MAGFMQQQHIKEVTGIRGSEGGEDGGPKKKQKVEEELVDGTKADSEDGLKVVGIMGIITQEIVSKHPQV